MIKAEVLQDSINPEGVRIITMILEFPRFILAEFNTHRVFSRNCASSRAIPTKTLVNKIKKETATPIYWGKNKSGMQAKEELVDRELMDARLLWERARDEAIKFSEYFASLGLHKQIANRVLEPFMNVQVVVSATEWNNFFLLRIHPDAQPEIQDLANKMLHAIKGSTPQELKAGDWHIPFISKDESNLDLDTKLKISTARCARTSYYFHDGKKSTVEKDIELHERLVNTEPPHCSPAEHQAQSMGNKNFYKNFRGWKQYRQVLEDG
jgi:thymidylate synthase ThyX